MTPEEQFESMISWAYWIGAYDCPGLTIEGLRREALKLWPDGKVK